MKLRLLSLVLLGITLLDVTQARTIEKKEVNQEDPYSVCSCNNGECNRCDDNGCEQVSNCNGKREASSIDYAGAAKLLEIFKADDSICKCLHHGYCLERKPGQNEYTEVNGCGESKCYTQCDITGCRKVCDGQCECDGEQRANARCEKCDDKGCVQVQQCWVWRFSAIAKQCKECDEYGCYNATTSLRDYAAPEQPVKEGFCNRQCNDNLDDVLLQDKCVCKKDENGNEKCEMCSKYQCNPVADCSTFSTCKCTLNSHEDTYRRCHGYTHGEQHCRTMYSCTEFNKRDAEWLEKRKEGYGSTCEKMNNGLTKDCVAAGECRYNPCSQDDIYTYMVTAHLH